jgi:hypothetical protein
MNYISDSRHTSFNIMLFADMTGNIITSYNTIITNINKIIILILEFCTLFSFYFIVYA